jgi:hypothetical protein
MDTSAGAQSQNLEIDGYTLGDDLCLHPTYDTEGRIHNVNLNFRPHELCSFCVDISQELRLRPREDPPLMPYWSTVADLRLSALHGCHLCSQFYARVCRLSNEANQVGRRPLVTFPQATGSISMQHFLYKGPFPDEEGDLIPVHSDEALIHHEKQAYPAILSASLSSEACFNLASSWLAECLQKHPDCQRLQQSITKSPTRLIEITSGDELRLFYPDSRVPYISVSHCWGQSRPFQLTKANHDELVRGLPLRSLPRLFQDFITVASRFGVRYIWIDSLCIIQDSTDDWKKEAGLMGSVYRGAVCNIAAVSSSDCKASLFTRIHPLISFGCWLNVDSFPDLHKYSHPKDGRYKQEDIDVATPLYWRAWVLQERILAPRILEYHQDGLTWRCGHTSHSTTPSTAARSFDWRILSTAFNDLLSLRKHSLTEELRQTGSSNWDSIISVYSKCRLTYESDRPLAIDGIISLIEQQTGLQFLAGVCVEFFPYFLLWAMPNGYIRHPVDATPHIPSWSKTYIRDVNTPSVSGLHTYFKQGVAVCSEVRVDMTELQLEFKTRAFGPVLIREKGTPQDDDDGGMVAFIENNSDVGGSVHGAKWSLRPPYTKSKGFSFLNLIMDITLARPVEAHLLLIAIGPEDKTDCHGIIVTRTGTTTGARDVWKRIGMFRGDAIDPILDMVTGSIFDFEREYKLR